MFVSRVVVVPADGADADLRFPLASADDQLEYTFDFSAWLAQLDRIANATVLPDATLTLGAVTFTARRVTARLGPATAPGACVIRCAVVTPQGREKCITATVMLQ